jgi:hypothetical protein
VRDSSCQKFTPLLVKKEEEVHKYEYEWDLTGVRPWYMHLPHDCVSLCRSRSTFSDRRTTPPHYGLVSLSPALS